MKKQNKLAYSFILPSAIIMILITFYPLFYGVWMAFTNFSTRHIRHQNPDFIGIQNFIDILSQAPYLDLNFFNVLIFNLIWTVSNLIFHVSFGVLLALVINLPKLWGKKIYRAVLILPWAIPTYVTALVWKNMYDQQFGAINQFLKMIGLPSSVNWLQQFPEAFYAVLVTNIWLGFPFMMMVASGALQSIPRDFYEAAEVDGANWWQRFINITVPMLKPAMIPAIMLGFIWTFNNFNVIYFISNGGPLGKTEILVTQAFKLVNPLGLYGVAAAFSIVIFFILFGLSMINMKVNKTMQEV